VGDDALALALPGRIARSLAQAAAGVPTFFMHGNRDFMVASGFAAAAGVRLIEDPTRIELHGRPTLLMHGDTLCTGDAAYQAFRAKVRDPRWQQAALARPIAERLAIARDLRGQSENAKLDKSMGIMDVAPEAVEEAFAQSGCEVLIHGHTHRPGRHVHQVRGSERVRWVLADWYRSASYLEATPAGIRPVELPAA
jgi:UDP-2,3-diacylglucosamine hydrolase